MDLPAELLFFLLTFILRIPGDTDVHIIPYLVGVAGILYKSDKASGTVVFCTRYIPWCVASAAAVRIRPPRCRSPSNYCYDSTYVSTIYLLIVYISSYPSYGRQY